MYQSIGCMLILRTITISSWPHESIHPQNFERLLGKTALKMLAIMLFAFCLLHWCVHNISPLFLRFHMLCSFQLIFFTTKARHLPSPPHPICLQVGMCLLLCSFLVRFWLQHMGLCPGTCSIQCNQWDRRSWLCHEVIGRPCLQFIYCCDILVPTRAKAPPLTSTNEKCLKLSQPDAVDRRLLC